MHSSSSYVEIELTRPVLLVDGYNMCGYWPKLKKHFKRGHLDYARQTLLEELVTFGAVKGEISEPSNSFSFRIFALVSVHINF